MPRGAAIPRDFHPLAAHEGLKATRHSTPAEKNQKPSTCSLNLQGRDGTQQGQGMRGTSHRGGRLTSWVPGPGNAVPARQRSWDPAVPGCPSPAWARVPLLPSAPATKPLQRQKHLFQELSGIITSVEEEATDAQVQTGHLILQIYYMHSLDSLCRSQGTQTHSRAALCQWHTGTGVRGRAGAGAESTRPAKLPAAGGRQAQHPQALLQQHPRQPQLLQCPRVCPGSPSPSCPSTAVSGLGTGGRAETRPQREAGWAKAPDR